MSLRGHELVGQRLQKGSRNVLARLRVNYLRLSKEVRQILEPSIVVSHTSHKDLFKRM